jgi:arylsulfatase A-like enzyme
MNKLKGMMFFTLVIMLMGLRCTGPDSDQPLLTAKFPLHLEEHLDAAKIIGSEVPEDLPAPVEWHFDKPQPDWKPAIPINQTTKPVKVIRTEDALRVILNESNFNPNKQPRGGIYIDLPDLFREEWGYVLVQARTSDKFSAMFVCFNLNKNPEQTATFPYPFLERERVDLIRDGSVQTYLVCADKESRRWKGPWKQLGLWFRASEPGKVDILSVSVIPKDASFAGAPTGISTEIRNDVYRRTLYTHVPGRLEYKVRVPKAGRLDVGLGVLRKDVPVTFRITAKAKGSEVVSLLEETYADSGHWEQRSVNLSSMSGQVVTLALEADAERVGTVALWSAPTLTGTRSTKKPNVIFYIIDGAGADYMSVYGYNRRTTPNLERLAAEGAVFEYAYSNAFWTKPSTMSFMTSLQHSVLGSRTDSDPLPKEAVTMAEHMHRAGYQTGVFISNPLAGSMSNLQRAVDVFREADVENNSASSIELHEDFWSWREAYPGEPYWVHFQTTDVHGPYRPVAPFAGLFVTPELKKTFYEWNKQLLEEGGNLTYSKAFEKTGLSRVEFFNTRRGLYDETMAHNDYQIGRLVERLKAEGEWKNTLLIVGADHSTLAIGGKDLGLGLLDSLPPRWNDVFSGGSPPNFRSSMTRIPLIVVWPERIVAGQRFSQPVSMIDMLPTILDLLDLPMPEVMQGQSLAPLLLSEEGLEPRPVILDMLAEHGWLCGDRIGVIDGRWGASLEVNLNPEQPPDVRRPAPLLLYDLWNDPLALHPMNDKQPDLVDKYTEFLKKKWEEHRELAKLFSRSGKVPLTPDQLEILRTLGYIR